MDQKQRSLEQKREDLLIQKELLEDLCPNSPMDALYDKVFYEGYADAWELEGLNEGLPTSLQEVLAMLKEVEEEIRLYEEERTRPQKTESPWFTQCVITSFFQAQTA